MEHSPDDVIVQLIGINSLHQNKGSTDGAVLDHSRNKSKGKRKGANQPTSLSKKVKKLRRTPETVEELLKYIKEYKTKREFNGVDFEALEVSAALLAEIALGITLCMLRRAIL